MGVEVPVSLLTRTKDFGVWITRANTGDYRNQTAEMPEGEPPRFARWLQGPWLLFVGQGSFDFITGFGEIYQMHPGLTPRQWHVLGTHRIVATADDSEMICMMCRDTSALWGRERLILTAGKPHQLAANPLTQVLFVAQGSISVDGVSYPKHSLITLDDGRPHRISAESDCNLLHAYKMPGRRPSQTALNRPDEIPASSIKGHRP